MDSGRQVGRKGGREVACSSAHLLVLCSFVAGIQRCIRCHGFTAHAAVIACCQLTMRITAAVLALLTTSHFILPFAAFPLPFSSFSLPFLSLLFPLPLQVSSFSSEAVAAAMERRSQRGRRGRRKKPGEAISRAASISKELPATLHEEEAVRLGLKDGAAANAAVASAVAVPDELLELREWTDNDSLRWLNACARDFTVNA